MNLVDLYLELTVFPLHKILNWRYEQSVERDVLPVFSIGSPSPRSFSRSARRARRIVYITFNHLNGREANMLRRKIQLHEPIVNLKLKAEHSTFYINKGYITNIEVDEPGFSLYSYNEHEVYTTITVECDNLAVQAEPPVTSFEQNVYISSRSPESPKHGDVWFNTEDRSLYIREGKLLH